MINIDRTILQAQYIDRILEGMDLETLMVIVQEHLEADFDQLGDEDLIAEVSIHYPDLLED
jgi:hypothetical protein